MIRKTLITTVVLLLVVHLSFAQDRQRARRVIDTLASEPYQGRGFINHGAERAAQYIARRFSQLRLQSLTPNFFQPFTLSGNLLTGTVALTIDGKVLKPGVDFLVSAASPSVKGAYKAILLDSVLLDDKAALAHLRATDLSKSIVLYDRKGVKSKEAKAMLDSLRYSNLLKAVGYGELTDKLTWGAGLSRRLSTYPSLTLLRERFPKRAQKLTLEIGAEFKKEIPACNVIGWVAGKERPDSFLVVSAHYDHLGLMGRGTWFPGASDNASGVAALLDLAAYFSQPAYQPRYSIAFIAFTGEESGLQGSAYFVEHPLFPLNKIRFAINMDMMGTGSDGLSVVSGDVYRKEGELLSALNDQKRYLVRVFLGPGGCSSDNCSFDKKGVRCFDLFTRGNENTEYHSVTDTADRLPLTAFEDTMRLLIDFLNAL